MVRQDSLAAGKDVVMTKDFATALQHTTVCTDAASLSTDREPGVTPTPGMALHGTGPTAGTTPAASPAIAVGEYLDGPEASAFCSCDGENVVTLPPVQDHRHAHDGGGGPSTGGMGVYSLLPWAPPDLE